MFVTEYCTIKFVCIGGRLNSWRFIFNVSHFILNVACSSVAQVGVFLPVPDRNQRRRETIRRSRSRSQVVAAHRWWSLRERDIRCVDFRKWFQPRGQNDPKPTRKGIAFNLDQWVRMRRIVEEINNDHPVLAAALPCYMQDGHLATFECRECYPFLKDSDKSFEFTPSRLVLCMFVTKYCISRFVCIGERLNL